MECSDKSFLIGHVFHIREHTQHFGSFRDSAQIRSTSFRSQTFTPTAHLNYPLACHAEGNSANKRMHLESRVKDIGHRGSETMQ